ncbi:hypothetical protein [Tautonia plasticadhaerens]|uniref:Uncharacterized protein n=1 Tax=Tautonia plasticadhaerens TaxID=2527974 RepID=A0A518GZI5_9BACT|nr:hypothetical protein [Tautonia plasticadhaerens]QDV34009.1 hypothetical protein ElP_18900 [Tautonia plasticadhaerens]
MANFSLIQPPGKGRSGSKDAQRQRSYSVPYQVESDDPAGTEAEVLAFVEGQVGTIGAAHPGDDGAFIRSIRVQEEAEDGCSWSAEVEYGPWEPMEESPLEEPAEVAIDWAPRERVVERAWAEDGGSWGLTGVITNSAGDVFDPPVVRDDSRPILRISTNEPSYPIALAGLYRDTVNDADVSIGGHTFAAKTLKAAAPKARRQWSPNVAGGFYWRIDYEFEINEETWVHQQLDNGFRYLDSGSFKQALSSDGQPASSPVLLDGSGAQLAAGGDPVALEFDLYEPRSFQAGFTFFT